MTTLTLRERINLTRLRREIARGERNEMLTDSLERARLEFVKWRIRDTPECSCGRSDGDGCHCDDTGFKTNYG